MSILKTFSMMVWEISLTNDSFHYYNNSQKSALTKIILPTFEPFFVIAPMKLEHGGF